MQAAQFAAPRRLSLSWLGVLPAAVVVALSMQACSANVPNSDTLNPVNSTNPTDPSCRPQTCTTLGKNCGILNDGCGGTLRCGTCAGTGNDCRNNVCDRGCSTNSECPSGSTCLNGSCTDKCSGPSDCPSGQYCNGGTCAPNAATSCRYDSECRGDERCVSNQCIGTSNGTYRNCLSDSECRGGEACRSGSCQSVGGRTCRYNQDCATNESCTNGYCSNQGGNGSCNYDSDCGYNERCSYGVCRTDSYGSGNVNAECNTRSIGVSFGGIGLNFATENWLYDSRDPNGIRVDSCTCPDNSRMHIQDQWGSRDIPCSRCIKNGDERTCYQ